MGPFRIIRRIKRLIYKLKLPSHQKTYPVFTIIIFKSGLTIENDPYNRFRPDYSDSVFVNEDTEFLKSFKINKIIDKRVIYKGRIKKRIIKYLVRQIGYEPEKDRWYNQACFDRTKILIKKYKRDFFINRALLILLSDIITLNISSPTVFKNIKKERNLSRKRGRLKKVPLPLIEKPRNSKPRGKL